jgi:hypothetical protein
VKRLGALLLCAGMLVCSSCSNIKNEKVTDENNDKILNQISTSKDLTDGERQLLAAYVIRQNVANIFGGGKPGLPTGKTVGEMIADQRQWAAQEKVEEDRQKQLASAVAAKQAEMRNVIGVALYGFTERQMSFSDYAEAKFAYENRSDKDVRAFEGTVAFSDVLGNHLDDVQLKVLAPIKAGAKASVSDDLPFMAYGGLRGKKLEDVKIEWRPQKILFADGTSAEDGSIKE